MSSLNDYGDIMPRKRRKVRRKKKEVSKKEKKNEKRGKTSKKGGSSKKYPKTNKHGKASTSYLRRKSRLKSSRGKTIEVTHQKKVYQTKRGVKLDKERKALPPGWRVSKDGHLYYEDRSNRSDRPGSRL